MVHDDARLAISPVVHHRQQLGQIGPQRRIEVRARLQLAEQAQPFHLIVSRARQVNEAGHVSSLRGLAGHLDDHRMIAQGQRDRSYIGEVPDWRCASGGIENRY